MPVFMYPQPGGNPLLSFIIGLATIAVVVGLAIFFLPFIASLVLGIILLGLAFWVWNWLKIKMGWESKEVKDFREAMQRAEEEARRQYGAARGEGTVYEREEVRVTRIGSVRDRRRNMQDVEDIEEIR